jgi:hypothetical protein
VCVCVWTWKAVEEKAREGKEEEETKGKIVS